ncbi:peptidoglycan-binding protein LysM, partial [Streptomyces sp. WAC04770]
MSGPAASAPSRAAGAAGAAGAVGAAGAAPPPAFAAFAARCTGGVAFGRTVRTVFAAGSSPVSYTHL